jgi:hypothetical protein
MADTTKVATQEEAAHWMALAKAIASGDQDAISAEIEAAAQRAYELAMKRMPDTRGGI